MEGMAEQLCNEKHKKVDADLRRIETNVNNQGAELKSVSTILAEQAIIMADLAQFVKDMREKPERRWDAIITQIISLIIAAGFGALLSQII